MGVIPISTSRSRCQRADRASTRAAPRMVPTRITALPTARAVSVGCHSLARPSADSGRRGRTHFLKAHSSTQPTAYPMAALIPHTRPSNSQVRGSNEGDTAQRKKIQATTRPG